MIYFINLPLVSNMALITIFSKKNCNSQPAVSMIVRSRRLIDNSFWQSKPCVMINNNKIENLLFHLTAKRGSISAWKFTFESFPFFPNFVIPDLDSYHTSKWRNWKLVTRYEHNNSRFLLVSIAFHRLIHTCCSKATTFRNTFLTWYNYAIKYWTLKQSCNLILNFS